MGSTEYITMLRRPVDRVISNYCFVARTPEHRHYETVTGEGGMSLYEYVSSGVNKALDNQMVKNISGSNTKNMKSDREALRKAKRNMKKWFGVVGLVEHFDRSITLMKKKYKWKDVSYCKKKVSNDKPNRQDLADRTINEIKKKNQLDLELYRFAEERINKEIKNANIEKELYSLYFKCWIKNKKKIVKEKTNSVKMNLKRLVKQTSKSRK
jgi:hypothetical protein